MEHIDNSNINEVYSEFWNLIVKLSKEYSPEEIAGVMSAQAMMLYRTMLTEDDYEAMTTAIYNSRNKIKRLDIRTLQ